MANFVEEIGNIMNEFKDKMKAVVARLGNAIDDDLEIIKQAHTRIVDNGKIVNDLSVMFDNLVDDMKECADALEDRTNIVEDFRYSVEDAVVNGYLDDEILEDIDEEDFEDEDECDCKECCDCECDE
jgi:hypothetical protein